MDGGLPIGKFFSSDCLATILCLITCRGMLTLSWTKQRGLEPQTRHLVLKTQVLLHRGCIVGWGPSHWQFLFKWLPCHIVTNNKHAHQSGQKSDQSLSAHLLKSECNSWKNKVRSPGVVVSCCCTKKSLSPNIHMHTNFLHAHR